MAARLSLALSFVLVQLATTLLYLLVASRWARAARLAVREYVLGRGPVVARFGSFTLRTIPWSGYFTPVTRNGPIPVDPGSQLGKAIARAELRFYDDLPFAVGVGVALLSVAIPLLGSLACLGPAEGLHAAAAGLRGYVAGAFGPVSTGPALLDAALAFWRDAPAGQRLGWLFAVGAGMNLLWTPTNVMMLLGLSRPRAWRRGALLGWLAWRAMELAWLVGVVLWVVRADG